MSRLRVLFVCTANSARSQLAEALLRHLASDRFEVSSAGIEPAGVNPFALRVLEEAGVDTSGLRSQGIGDFLGESFDYVITVCGGAEQRCPVWPGSGTRLHWPFDDPAVARGTYEERLDAFRRARDLIEARIRSWLASL